MRKLRLLAALAAIVAVGCQQENFDEVVLPDNDTIAVEQSGFRSYDEALEIAENSIRLIEGKDVTRSTMKRRIIKNNVQTIRSNATRSGNTSDDPVAYVVNFEDNQGFAVIAANEQINPLIAVTESGNYTYGEPTGVEAFDDYMDNAISTLAIVYPPIILPDDPITPIIPTPAEYYEDVDIYNRVEPLLTTRWGQGGIHGAKYPNGHVLCAAVAVGQILAYHKKPTSIQMTHSNNTNVTIDWDGILDHDPTITYTEYVDYCHCGCNYDALGELLYEIGYRLSLYDQQFNPNITHVCDGSGYTASIESLLIDIGYYSAELDSFYVPYGDKYQIFRDLDSERPVIMYGESPNGDVGVGHVWIVDGYHEESSGQKHYITNPAYNSLHPVDGVSQYILHCSTVETTEMLHFNWGYDGHCNGWFTYGIFDLGSGVSYDNTGYWFDNNIDYDFSSYLYYIYDIKSWL